MGGAGLAITAGAAVLVARAAAGWSGTAWVADLAVGAAFAALAGSTWSRSRGSAWLAWGVAIAWAAGTAWPPVAAAWHVGPLSQLVVAAPGARPRRAVGLAAVGLAWAAAATAALHAGEVEAVIGGVVVGGAVIAARAVRLRSGGGRPAVAAAAALTAALVAPAVERALAPGLTGWWTYCLALVAVAGLVALELRERHRDAVADLTVRLAPSRPGDLARALARVVGDRRLELGWWEADRARFVAADGHVVAASGDRDGRVDVRVDDGDVPVALVVHAAAVGRVPGMDEALADALRLTALHRAHVASLRRAVEEIRLSRARLSAAERAELASFAERLETEVLAPLRALAPSEDVVATDLVERLGGEVARIVDGLAAPVTPGELANALTALADGFPLAATVRCDVDPPSAAIASTVWFVCAESLVNAVRHGGASRVDIEVHASAHGTLVVTVTDDGDGGLRLVPAGGVAGLRDRVAAHGGELTLSHPSAGGSRVRAVLPTSVDAHPVVAAEEHAVVPARLRHRRVRPHVEEPQRVAPLTPGGAEQDPAAVGHGRAVVRDPELDTGAGHRVGPAAAVVEVQPSVMERDGPRP